MNEQPTEVRIGGASRARGQAFGTEQPNLYGGAPLGDLFPERGDLARGALALAELVGAVCWADGSRLEVRCGSTLDRFLEDCFPERMGAWPWGFVRRPRAPS
jgi:hypothetical protein